MTYVDIRDLLHAAAPEPPAALRADTMLRAARRRRSARTGATAAAGVAVAVAVPAALAARPVDTPVATPVTTTPTPPASHTATPPPTRLDRAAVWPEEVADMIIQCKASYPEGLGTAHAVALDGTVVDVHVGPRNDDAGGSPVRLDVNVHRVFAGPARTSVTLHTWDFMMPRDPHSVVGIRILAATGGDRLVLNACGYSRRWSAAEADVWARAFKTG